MDALSADDGEGPRSRFGRLIRDADRSEGLVKAVRAARGRRLPVAGDRPSNGSPG